jgi:hypothetical protein
MHAIIYFELAFDFLWHACEIPCLLWLKLMLSFDLALATGQVLFDTLTKRTIRDGVSSRPNSCVLLLPHALAASQTWLCVKSVASAS